MAASLCPCCNDLVEVLLSLPCHSEHRLCGGCLERQTATIAQSIKCPDCRTRTAWLKPELLLVSDGKIPEQQTCSPCRNDGKRGVVADFFCQECQHGMCAHCNRVHSRFFKSNTKHASIDFVAYRKKADLMTRRYCTRAGHEYEVLAFVCPGCQTKSCLMCWKKSCECQVADQTIGNYLEPKIALLRLNQKVLAQRADKTASNTKEMQESVEQLRVICESLIESINMDHGLLVARLAQERDSKIDKVRGYLKQCAEEVTDYLERSKESESEFRDLAESIPVLLDSTHPAHLIDVFQDVSAVTRRAVERPADKPLPLYNPALLRESRYRRSSIIFPLMQKISFLHNVQLEDGSSCYSADVDHSGVIYHRDSLKKHGFLKSPSCIRRLENGDLFTLDRSSVIRYVEINPKIWGIQWRQTSILEVYPSKMLRHFVVTDALVILVGGDEDAVYIFDRLEGEKVGEVSDPELKQPWGICQNEAGDVYCTDFTTGSIFTFNLADTNAVRRICTGLDSPSGVALHRDLLYVLRNTGGKMYVITQEGELLNTLGVPEVQADAHDIRINDDGMVVIANREHGIQVYQLSPPEERRLKRKVSCTQGSGCKVIRPNY